MSAGLLSGLGAAIAPALRALDAETAHRLTIKALAALPALPAPASDPRLAVSAFGLAFPNPLGLAAGFDKDAQVADAMLHLGFGFVEVGTLTPRPQAGNPRPRIFRLPGDRAVINRLGFNNAGHDRALARLRRRGGRPGLIGANLGANKDTADRPGDYVAGVRAFAPVAAYFTINISSPNTPGLRELQAGAALDDLLARVMEARERALPRRPVLIKIAPDLTLAELDTIIACALRRQVDGLIISNTTLSRPRDLRDARLASEPGGLSGTPLFAPSTALLAAAFLRVEGRFALVGVGGIDGADAAWTKLEAGATLVQLYSALIYAGPGLAGRILEGIVDRLAREKLRDLAPVVGRRARDLALA